MSSTVSQYATLPPIRASLFNNPPDTVPPTDELEQLQSELIAFKTKSLERAKKAGDDIRTIEESMRRLKEKEKGKAKALQKERERQCAYACYALISISDQLVCVPPDLLPLESARAPSDTALVSHIKQLSILSSHLLQPNAAAMPDRSMCSTPALIQSHAPLLWISCETNHVFYASIVLLPTNLCLKNLTCANRSEYSNRYLRDDIRLPACALAFAPLSYLRHLVPVLSSCTLLRPPLSFILPTLDLSLS